MKLGVLLSAVLGYALSTGSTVGLATSILAPAVFLRQRSRAHTSACAAVYYLAALRDLPIVSRNFFGPTAGLLEGIPLWIIVAGLLSLPWLWAWSPSRVSLFWRCPIALLSSVLPPLGIIGLASPMAAAGFLFPGTGCAGFVLTLFLPALLINSAEPASFAWVSLVLLCHLLTAPQPPPPGDWAAINTTFGPVGHGDADLIREYQVAKRIETEAWRAHARVVIFPEAVAPDWIDAVVPSGKIILVGAVEPIKPQNDLQAELFALTGSLSAAVPARSSNYRNELLVRGTQIGEFAQRVPIPIGMWKPFTGTGVPLNLTGPGTLSIDGHRAAIIICYEQLIAWPVLASFFEHPSMIVAVSNNVWVSGTAIPRLERKTMESWASLFSMPLLSASNT